MRKSYHYNKERAEREQHIKEIGYGKPIARFIVDRGHENGPEIHEITDTVIINIYNERTKKLVTKLIARPGQIKRYFTDRKAPQELVNRAKQNTALGYNY